MQLTSPAMWAPKTKLELWATRLKELGDAAAFVQQPACTKAPNAGTLSLVLLQEFVDESNEDRWHSRGWLSNPGTCLSCDGAQHGPAAACGLFLSSPCYSHTLHTLRFAISGQQWVPKRHVLGILGCSWK